MARSEEEILAGVVRLRLGRPVVVVDVPERTIDETAEWQRLMAEAVGGITTGDLGDSTAMTGLLSLVGDRMQDLIVAYDTSGQVTHDRLRRCTPAQVYDAFRTVLEAVYPYVRDVQGAVSILMPLIRAGSVALAKPTGPTADQSPGQPSTNGRSMRGDTGHLTSVPG